MILLGAVSAVKAETCAPGYHVRPSGECGDCPPSGGDRGCPPECTLGRTTYSDSSCTTEYSGEDITSSPPPSPSPPTPSSSSDAGNVGINPFSGDCTASGTCSPSQCTVSADVACSFPTAGPVDFAAKVSQATCKQCTQDTSSAKCQTLAQTLRTNAGVKAAYCNADFLVIWADGLPSYNPNAAEYLPSIPLPPGGGTVNGATCRVKTATEKLTVYKIPLSTTVQAGSNTIPSPLPGVPGMPAAGAMGVAVDGTPIFANYNNRGGFAWESCELDVCNAHSGKGEDYHLHGDPFGSKCMYSSDDYESVTHPPVIGFAFDGYPIHGRHIQAGYLGEDVALDGCGGHDHDGIGYHYHAHTVQDQTASKLDGTSGSNFQYNQYLIAPTTCWRGNVDVIDNFWGGGQANYDRSKNMVVSGWSDLEQLRPCCATSKYYVAAGIAIDGATAQPDEEPDLVQPEAGGGGGTPAVTTTAPTPSVTPTVTNGTQDFPASSAVEGGRADLNNTFGTVVFLLLSWSIQ